MGCCTCSDSTWVTVITRITAGQCVVHMAISIIRLLIYSKTLTIEDYDEYIDDDLKSLVFSVASIVLDLIWFISSITLRILRGKNVDQKQIFFFYIFWLLISFADIALDVTGIIMYSINFNTDKFEKPVTMLLVSSRFVIVFILNIAFFIKMILITTRINSTQSEDENKNIFDAPQFRQEEEQEKVEEEQERGKEETEYEEEPSPKPNQRIVPLKKPAKPALKNTKVPHLEQDNVPRVQNWYKNYDDPNSSPPETNGYQHGSGNENRNSYGNGNGNVNGASAPTFSQGYENMYPQSYMQMSNPSHNSSADNSTTGIPGSNTNVLVNGVPSGTLRRQLPWSYFPEKGVLPQRALKKAPPPPPRHRGSPSPTNVPLPYVPAPDYDNKPKQIERRNLQQNGWSQYL